MERSTLIDRQTLGIFWRASLRYKRLLILGMLFPLGTVLTTLAALFIGKALGALASPDGQPEQYLLMFVAVAAAGLTLNRIGHPAVMKHQALVWRDIQEQALATLLRRSVGFHNNNIGGKLVSDAVDYPQAYSRLHDAIATTLAPLSMTLLAGSAFIYAESWHLGLFVTIMTIATVGLGMWDSHRRMPQRIRRMLAGKDVTAHLADAITNIQTVKTFSHDKQELGRHRRLSDILTDIRISDWRMMSLQGNTRLAFLVAMQALLILIIIRQVQHSPALLGIGIFAFSYTVTLTNKLFDVNMLIRNIEEALLQASPMTKIVQQAPEILDAPNAKKLVVPRGAVRFNNVTFAYSDGDGNSAVFKHLDLDIAAGEKVGLVGPSGGGKSTLTRLLLRFDDIDKGSIIVDGQDVSAVTQESLRMSVAYVPQEPLLFHRSICENLAYGRLNATLGAVKAAARSAHADEFIGELKNGYKTIVGERGVKLSGGQRQRIAIARAILKDAPILVLDEATSALDSESEVLIQDALWRLMEGRTAIVVAHRLSTIQRMDRIVVLDKGKIVEQGTHRELLQRRGLYAKLWMHQSGGFLKSDS